MARAPLMQYLSCTMILLGLAATGCRTAKPLPPADLTAPGWTIRQGQAIWQTEGSDLAGEVIFGIGPDQRALLQFIKTPLPIVSAQTDGIQWTVHFATENRNISGRGTPPAQLIWLHLSNALRGTPPPSGYTFKSDSATGGWELANTKSGEAISGFLNP